MKKTLKSLGLSTLFFALLIFVLAFVFSALCKNNIISADQNDMILGAVGIPLFFFFAYSWGFSVKKRGILVGIFLLAVYLTVALVLANINQSFTPLKIMFISIKSLALVCGSVIGVNISQKRAAKSAA